MSDFGTILTDTRYVYATYMYIYETCQQLFTMYFPCVIVLLFIGFSFNVTRVRKKWKFSGRKENQTPPDVNKCLKEIKLPVHFTCGQLLMRNLVLKKPCLVKYTNVFSILQDELKFLNQLHVKIML